MLKCYSLKIYIYILELRNIFKSRKFCYSQQNEHKNYNKVVVIFRKQIEINLLGSILTWTNVFLPNTFSETTSKRFNYIEMAISHTPATILEIYDRALLEIVNF